MFNVSDLFKTRIAQPDREFDIKVTINGKDYLTSEVIEFDIEDSLIPSEEFTIGTVISSKSSVSVRTPDTIPTNAKITPYIRLNGPEGYTEWVQLGDYYIDSRSYNNNVWRFSCLDKLITTQQPFVSGLVYPTTMDAVFDEICAQLGIVRDSSVVIDPSYMVSFVPDGCLIRDMLGYIASANSASVRMTKEGKLGFVKFSVGAAKTQLLPSAYVKVNQTNPVKTFTRIVVTYNSDGEFLEIGSGDEDHTLKAYNPLITEAILSDMYAALNGFSYAPFTTDWKCFPQIEVGDSLEIFQLDNLKWIEADIAWQDADFPWENMTSFSSIMITNKLSFKGGLKATSTAPSQSTQQSEFGFKGTITQQVEVLNKTTIKEDKPYYGVTFGRAKGLDIQRSDGKSEVKFNSDEQRWMVDGQDRLWYDALLNKLRFSGDLEMLGGSILWTEVNPPTATDVGAKPYDWSPDVVDVNGLSGMLSYMDAYGIYSGTLAAENLVGYYITGKTIRSSATGARIELGPSGFSMNDGTVDRLKIGITPGSASMWFADSSGVTVGSISEVNEMLWLSANNGGLVWGDWSIEGYEKSITASSKYSPIGHNHDSSYSLLGHTHNDYITGYYASINYSDINHTHDSRYYTETESDHRFGTRLSFNPATRELKLLTSFDELLSSVTI